MCTSFISCEKSRDTGGSTSEINMNIWKLIITICYSFSSYILKKKKIDMLTLRKENRAKYRRFCIEDIDQVFVAVGLWSWIVDEMARIYIDGRTFRATSQNSWRKGTSQNLTLGIPQVPIISHR